jgi:ketosteroid isomerase-like protein
MLPVIGTRDWESTMSTGTVARRLIELSRAGDFNRAFDELYAEDACSFEVRGGLVQPTAGARGLAAIRRKSKAFQQECLKLHAVLVSDPLVAGPYFTIARGFDATYKDGTRRSDRTVCVYEVRNGKIVREQYFLPPV